MKLGELADMYSCDIDQGALYQSVAALSVTKPTPPESPSSDKISVCVKSYLLACSAAPFSNQFKIARRPGSHSHRSNFWYCSRHNVGTKGFFSNQNRCEIQRTEKALPAIIRWSKNSVKMMIHPFSENRPRPRARH